MVLVSVQVCSGPRVIRDWGLVPVSDDSTLLAVFEGLSYGVVESGDGWRLPEEYSNSPITCMVARSQSGPFQSVPIAVKICEASEFGKFFKFLLQSPINQQQAAQSQQNALEVVMRNAGQLMWPDKYDNSRKTQRHQLHNDLIDFLQEKGLGCHKENVLSAGKPFVTQLVDVLWQVDGHHPKLAAQQCEVPSLFSVFSGYNTPENYKQKRPNLKRDRVVAMSQNLFGILQQVGNI